MCPVTRLGSYYSSDAAFCATRKELMTHGTDTDRETRVRGYECRQKLEKQTSTASGYVCYGTACVTDVCPFFRLQRPRVRVVASITSPSPATRHLRLRHKMAIGFCVCFFFVDFLFVLQGVVVAGRARRFDVMSPVVFFALIAVVLLRRSRVSNELTARLCQLMAPYKSSCSSVLRLLV